MNEDKKIISIEDRIRVDNIKRYIDEHFDGNISAFGREIGFSPSQSNNLGNSLKGTRALGKTVALQIEAALKFPIGTLSQLNCVFPRSQPDEVVIPVYNNDAAAGIENHLFEDDNIMDDPARLPRSFVIKSGANPNMLAGLIAQGVSMQERISNGAIVIIDRSQTRLESGEIYCFIRNNHKRQIKYLIEGVNGLIIKSHNPQWPDEVIPYNSENQEIDLQIDGKVVFVINPIK